MQFKQKLAYITLGGLFVFIGQLLPTIIGGRATAQHENTPVEFETVTCRRLKIVDDSGKTYLLLEKAPNASGGYNAVQLFNDAGKAVCQILAGPDGGYVAVNANSGDAGAYLGIHRISESGVVKVSDKTGLGSASMSVDESGGTVNVSDKVGNRLAQMVVTETGGLLAVKSRDNEGFALMATDATGGTVSVGGKAGNRLAEILATETGGLVGVMSADNEGFALMTAGATGGVVNVSGKDRQGNALMLVDEAGGLISVKSKTGKGIAQMGISETGDGSISTADGNGAVIATLP